MNSEEDLFVQDSHVLILGVFTTPIQQVAVKRSPCKSHAPPRNESVSRYEVYTGIRYKTQWVSSV